MKKLLILSGLIFISFISFSQVQINLKDIPRRMGDSVVVCGQVYGGQYVTDGQDSLAQLNIGAASPKQQLLLVFKPSSRKWSKVTPLAEFDKKWVCIWGRLVMYNEQPAVIVYHPDQVTEAVKQ